MVADRAYETSVARFWKDADGIIYGSVKVGAHITENAARENFMILQKLSDGRPRPFLADIRALRLVPHREARLMFTDKTLVKPISAVAFLIESQIAFLMVTFFIRVSKPPFPTRAFQSRDDALLWLHNFME